MIINGHSFSRVIANKTAEAANALPTFSLAARYKAGWVDKKWKNPDKDFLPITRHPLPKLA